MKKTFIATLITVVFALQTQAQSCFVGGIEISSQKEINDFKIFYPSCKVIEGDVYIYGPNDITNLNGLSNLTRINGSLVITESPSLTSLAGLSKLQTISDGMIIFGNGALPNLNGLSSLTAIGTYFYVGYNDNMGSLNGLTKLASIGGNFTIEDSYALTNVDGLSQLSSIGGGIILIGNDLLTNLNGLSTLASTLDSLVIFKNPNLLNLNGLAGVPGINGKIDIFDNVNLTSIGGLTGLTNINGNINISGNNALGTLNGLNNLSTIGGHFTLNGNVSLASLNGLNSLASVGGRFSMDNNFSLQNLTGLSSLQFVGGDLYINNSGSLLNLSGLDNLLSIGGSLVLKNTSLTNITALQNLSSLGQNLELTANLALSNLNGLESLVSMGGSVLLVQNDQLTQLNGLQNLQSIGGDLKIQSDKALTDLEDLVNLTSIGGGIVMDNNDALISLAGLQNVPTIGGDVLISGNESLANLTGLDGLTFIGDSLVLSDNPALINLKGLTHLTTVNSGIYVAGNQALTNLSGLDSLTSINGFLFIRENAGITDLNGLGKLSGIGGQMALWSNPLLTDVDALSLLNYIGGNLDIQGNSALPNLDSLKNLYTVGGNLSIRSNTALTSLHGLNQLSTIGGTIEVTGNTVLAECAIPVFCYRLFNDPGAFNISNNGPGCKAVAELEQQCSKTPALATVRRDNNGDCLADAADTPVADVQVQFFANGQMMLRPTDISGTVQFNYFNNGPLLLRLPQFPTQNWAVCEDSIAGQDTLSATFLLTALNQCPELTVHLGLPPAFEDCSVISTVLVSVKNTGTISATGVQVAVVMPPVFELAGSTPALAAQVGDTLYFEVGDVSPLTATDVQIRAKTKCDSVLSGRTLCWATQASLENACPTNPQAVSNIRLSAQCIGGSTVRFTLNNVGNAPTQAPHTYTIFRNENILNTAPFALNAHQSIPVDVPADGATYRMEATRSDDGSLAATAIESCGGLTPGLITAFWLDEGPLDADFDCRQVAGAVAANRKAAIPAGEGPKHLLVNNRPLQYTITFMNPHSDTVRSVLLRDVLSAQLNVSTFRPGMASHPYTWQLLDAGTLEVLFDPIALPDSNSNKEASRGFFTFEIAQQADLPYNTIIENTALVSYDANMEFGTNTVRHTIAKLSGQTQSCLPDGITFSTQAEVDNFLNDNPGCTMVGGDMVITGSDIYDLGALSVLTAVGGDLRFYGSTTITSLNGLGNIKTVGKNLLIEYMDFIEDLDGLNSLRRVDSSINIRHNANLLTMNGLDSLKLVGNSFEIGANPLLTDLTALGHLTSIGKSLLVEGNTVLPNLNGLNGLQFVGQDIGVGANPALTSLDAFSKIRTIAGSVNIYDNGLLANLSSLSNLDTIRGGLSITSNGLSSLSGLNNLKFIGGDFMIGSNKALSDVNGLESLHTVGGGLGIGDNGVLTSLAGLSNLSAVVGGLSINYNSALTSLEDFANLSVVGGQFALQNNLAIISPGGPPVLQSIGGDLIIMGNNQLENLNGLGSLDSVGGYLIVQGNASQTSLSGMTDLRHIGGLQIEATAMQHLTGLDSIRTIPGNVLIDNNPALLDFKGLENLESVDGAVEIFVNAVLKNFNGLDKLRTIGQAFFLHDNPALQSFEGMNALESIADSFYLYQNQALINFSGLSGLRTIGQKIKVIQNNALLNFNGFDQLKTIGGLELYYNQNLKSLSGMPLLDSIGGDWRMEINYGLDQFGSFDSLRCIGGDFILINNTSLKDFAGLENLQKIGGSFNVPDHFSSFKGLGKLASIGGRFAIDFNVYLLNFEGLNQLKTIGGDFSLNYLFQLASMDGLNNLTHVGGDFFINQLASLTSLLGLENLSTVGGGFGISNQSPGVTSLKGLGNLVSIGGGFDVPQSVASFQGVNRLKTIGGNFQPTGLKCIDFSGLDSLTSIGTVFSIYYMPALNNLHGLEGLKTIGTWFRIENNPNLTSLAGLDNLVSFGQDISYISQNPLLSMCETPALCALLPNNGPNGAIVISQNAPGCNDPQEVLARCESTPVHVTVLLDADGDCLADSNSFPATDVQVMLSGNVQMNLRPSDAAGIAFYRFYEKGAFALHLPEYPTLQLEACQNEISLAAVPGSQDTLRATFLLKPLAFCPELTTHLGMPTNFRGCLAKSEVQVMVKNTGADEALSAKTAVVVPPVFEIVSSTPPFSGKMGDTLVFDLGDLKPFQNRTLKLTVNTRCDTFLLDQTLCWEAFSISANACPPVVPSGNSEIQLSAKCLSDTAVRFTLKNIGNAATQNLHEYRILRNADALWIEPFSLAAGDSKSVELKTDGATWRMEATKQEDGTRTAVALENCGGLTPRQINAFWLETGPAEYDLACREVLLAFDPNLKTAVPTGAGENHLIESGQHLLYTIGFQNTGKDTAFRVQLRDLLQPALDIETFMPVAASHPYTWEIGEDRLLKVLFLPILLPDSNVNETASHGYFSFEINVRPDLPQGDYFTNDANIVFDFNPPIVTNYVLHRIGQLLVRADEPQQHEMLWQVLGNPTRESAIFQAKKFIAGDKRFELYDVGGRQVRRAQFSGQSFDFQRESLVGGVYFFRIVDAEGRVFSGKIVVVE